MTTNLHGPLARYAARLHGSVADRHHVASPLGAWLLLALGASADDDATGTDPAAGPLAEALGTDPATAAQAAAALLDAPHPLVSAATAGWHRPDADSPALAAWRETLPRATTTGPLPDQAGLDAWAREHSAGLIERFPLTVSPRVVLALASALATRISWAVPFDVAPVAALGPQSPWASRLNRVLRTPADGHRAWIATTPEAGDVAVHVAGAQPAPQSSGGPDGQTDDGRGDDGRGDGRGGDVHGAGEAGAGLSVVSVAAAPEVAPDRVLAAAYRIAADADAATGRRSLFDLPLGATPLWTLREEPVRTHARDGREERHAATLPCWSARDEHDLGAPGLGFTALAGVLAPLIGDAELRARQVVAARYTRYGFEAAAVTGAFALTSLPPQGVRRVAELRFGHPYAVVAVATDRRGGPWHGVPVFSGWVADPDDLPEADLADPPQA